MPVPITLVLTFHLILSNKCESYNDFFLQKCKDVNILLHVIATTECDDY